MADARARLGVAYRRLAHSIAGHHVSVDDADALAAELDRCTALLESGEVRVREVERPTGDWGPAPVEHGAPMTSFDERPVSGRAAPLGFDVTVTREGDEAVGRLTLGRAHEGAPSRSHGGIVAALFDDLFGFVLTIAETAGFTGELTVRYEAGTPIGVPLECRVRLRERVGRKLLMHGELTLDGDPSTVFARSTATFISIDPDRFHLLSSTT